MTWSHLQLVLDLALIVAGVVWIAKRVLDYAQRPIVMPRPAVRKTAQPLKVSAHELGLAHRFASRVVGSSERPPDDDFSAIAALWPYVPSTWRVLPDSGSTAIAYIRPASVFLVLEDLVERLESISARMRSRRRRGRS